MPEGRVGRRRPGKRADYLLYYEPDLPIAVLEAKAGELPAGDGLQQAIDCWRERPGAPRRLPWFS